MSILQAMSEVAMTDRNLSCLQVIGCYDFEAHLYRWAEIADDAFEIDQQVSDPKNYASALMESMLWVSSASSGWHNFLKIASNFIERLEVQIKFGLLQIKGRDTRKEKVFHHLTKLFHPMSRASEDVFEFDRWFVSRRGGDPSS